MKHLLDLGLRFASVLYLIFQFLVVGLALLPAVLFVKLFWHPGPPLLLAFALGIGYLIFGLVYLVLVILIRHLIRFRSREGDYPFISSYAVRWAFLGSLVGLAKILILDHIKGMPVLNIGARCTVGQSSVVFPGATMEEGSVLGALSLLPKGKTLPAGTVWGGNPLREIHREGA